MKNSILGITVIIICFLFLNQGLSWYRRSYNRDRNINVGLRGLSKKLEQIDKSSEEIEKAEIEEEVWGDKIMISGIFEQFKLLKSNKVQTGFLAIFIPNFLCTTESISFDRQADIIVNWFIKERDYTEEEVSLLRGSLPKRDMNPDLIRTIGLSCIETSLHSIIRYWLMTKIIEENNYIIPAFLSFKVSERYELLDGDAKVKIIMKAIEDGKIANIDTLEKVIIKTYA